MKKDLTWFLGKSTHFPTHPNPPFHMNTKIIEYKTFNQDSYSTYLCVLLTKTKFIAFSVSCITQYLIGTHWTIKYQKYQ